MSRVGNNPITIPEGVSVEISDNKVVVKGKLGEIEQEFSDVVVKMNDGVINIERTIRSITQQKDQYIEYLIIDGKSSDGTLQKINIFKNKIPRNTCNNYYCNYDKNSHLSLTIITSLKHS